MISKKLITGMLFLSSLAGCAQNAALLGPAYSLAGGNVYHAGLSYGSNIAISKSTGKSVTQNIIEILNSTTAENNFKKKYHHK
tara:strand:+ start:184 stop:432 length:249 start_codon:yes stop_codon:yes gene_type:complete